MVTKLRLQKILLIVIPIVVALTAILVYFSLPENTRYPGFPFMVGIVIVCAIIAVRAFKFRLVKYVMRDAFNISLNEIAYVYIGYRKTLLIYNDKILDEQKITKGSSVITLDGFLEGGEKILAQVNPSSRTIQFWNNGKKYE